MKVCGWLMIALACFCGVVLAIDPGKPVPLAVLVIGVISSLGLAVIGGALILPPKQKENP